MKAIKPKHQRLVLVSLALAAIIAAGLLAAWSLRNQADYFYLPAQMQADPPPIGRSVRLGGMVKPGSIKAAADGVTIRFVVTDNAGSEIAVRYRGIVPDLFVENSGVVAEGHLGEEGTFIASRLLAKHDENYVPREMRELSGHESEAVRSMAEGQ